MKVFLFASRNAKEVLRDPVNLFFGLGFPLVLLALLSLINASLAPEAGNLAFWIRSLAPGAAMFGSIFMVLFAGMVLAKDRDCCIPEKNERRQDMTLSLRSLSIYRQSLTSVTLRVFRLFICSDPIDKTTPFRL